MQKINLRELYPDIYKTDTYLEVTDEVQAVFLADKRAEARYQRQMYNYKAHYSLDCDNGIEKANLVLTSDINCLQSLNHMLCYPLDNQLSHKNFLIRILCLISVFKNCPLSLLINTTEHLQGAFIVLGKSNNNISHLSGAICSDNDQIAIIDAHINHGITGSLQNIKLALSEKRNRQSNIFSDIFLLHLCRSTWD